MYMLSNILDTWSMGQAQFPFTKGMLADQFSIGSPLGAVMDTLLGNTGPLWYASQASVPNEQQIVPRRCVQLMIRQLNKISTQLKGSGEEYEACGDSYLALQAAATNARYKPF